MSIHHATIKRAQKLGVVLTEPKPGVFAAHWPKLNKRCSGTSAGAVLDDMTALMELATGYKAFKLSGDAETEFGITYKGEQIGFGASIRDAFAKARDAWKAKVADEGDDEGELPEDDEDERTGSVVPLRYKQLYAERGDPRCCGDWLAETLNELVLDGDGKLDVERMVEIGEANGVQCRSYTASHTPGWQGRFRMTTRNMLRGKVAISGTLIVPNAKDRKAPEDWRAVNMPKQKAAKGKAIAKAA